MKKSLGVFTALVGAALVTVVACSSSSNGGGSFSCTSKGPCPNDPTPTQEEISQCQALQSDAKCGSSFNAYVNCAVAAGGSCDSSGKSTGGVPASCQSQESTYTTCVISEIDAGGISFDSGTSGGNTDAGGSSGPTTTNCIALEACCTKLTGTEQSACQSAANYNNDQACQTALSAFDADGGPCAN
ncbi:MAG TPA: hypothetical protein VGI39_24125 [Polyangiaceae bacterium]